MVADTFSTDGVGVLFMGTGNDNNTWGVNANTFDFQVLADAIANALTISVTGGTLDLSGSPPPAASSQVRYAAIVITGTLGSNQIVQVPNLRKWWYVLNSNAGAFTTTFKTPSGSASAPIPQSGWQVVMCDGSNGVVIWPFNTAQIQMPDGSLSKPPFSNVNEPTSGLRRAGAGDWRLDILGVDVLQITAGVVNVLAPAILQQAGLAVIPPGFEMLCAIPSPQNGSAPIGWLRSNGLAVSRVTFANLFNAITLQIAGAVTAAGNPVISLPANYSGEGHEGAFVEGGSIPLGTTIVSMTSTTATLSAAPGANGTITIRLLPWGQGDGSSTFNVPDRRGRAVFGCDTDPQVGAANRITFAHSGIRGDRLNGTGGVETVILNTGNLPQFTPSGSIVVSSTGTNSYTPTGLVSVTASGTVAGASAGNATPITVTIGDPTHAHSYNTPAGTGNFVPGSSPVAAPATGSTTGFASTGVTASVTSAAIVANIGWSGTFTNSGSSGAFTGNAVTVSFTGNQVGAGIEHQNMPPMSQGYWMIKT